MTLLQASHESNPLRFLARCLREDRAAYPPTEAEKLRLRQETMPLSTFALFLRQVQGEDVSDEVCDEKGGGGGEGVGEWNEDI